MAHPRALVVLLLVAVVAGCSPPFARPFQVEPARVGAPRSVEADGLGRLAPPADKVIVAVYRFRDQTGQYRALENVSTFSTAVTQGATTILIRALEDSGWFVPIEREGLSNLLNERQIITTTRQQYGGPDGQQIAPLPPLLYAGVLLEGGIIGYDSNVLTGGAGARYLGTGASGQFRQDQVTVYLRAVSVQNGRVLKTVHTTKTIVSQKLDSGLFRFVDTMQLLEAEAGYSTNEPPVLAVTAAIEEAVVSLVVEGIEEGLWALAEPESAAARDMVTSYRARHDADARRDAFGRALAPELATGVRLRVGGGLSRIESDYVSPDVLPEATLGLSVPVGAGVSVGASGRLGGVDVGAENRAAFSATADLQLDAFPRAQTSPYARFGVGVIGVPDAEASIFAQVTLAIGLETQLSQRFGLFVEASNTYPFAEGLDGLVGTGTVHDNVWTGLVGLSAAF